MQNSMAEQGSGADAGECGHVNVSRPGLGKRERAMTRKGAGETAQPWKVEGLKKNFSK